ANLQELGSLSAGQHGGNPIRALDPNPGSVEHFRAGPQTVQNFAEEPFTRIYATALGDVLRAQLASEFADLGSLGNAGMVLPQPRHRRRIAREALVECQRIAIPIHWQWRAAG